MNNPLSVIFKFKAYSIEHACCNHMPLSNVLKFREGSDPLHPPISKRSGKFKLELCF